ncbi:MAG: ABC transporter permease subunit [Acidimicrobiia bacterium]|jgi:ABC-type nitrate/sulfonate/bicarbonate transport system permease component
MPDPVRRFIADQFWLRHLLFAAALFAVWEVYARIVDEPVLLPGPTAVVAALVSIIVDGSLLPALLESLQLLAIGFTSAVALGVFFGIVIGRYELMDRTFSPYFNGLYALPVVALVPLVLVWFGFGLLGRVIVVFLAAFFPILINTYTGVRDAPTDLIEVATAFGVSTEIGMLRRVVVPAAVPFIMAGIRLGIGRGVVGMAIAEVYLRLSGIGALISSYGAVFRTDFLMAAILPLPLLGIGLTVLFGYIEKRVRYWRVSAAA